MSSTDIPPPGLQAADIDERPAVGESEFMARKPNEPDLLASAKQRHTIGILKIKTRFFDGIRHVCYFIPYLGLAMLIVWVWHIIGPLKYRWLDPDEITHLQSLMFSGAISALVTAIATKAI